MPERSDNNVHHMGMSKSMTETVQYVIGSAHGSSIAVNSSSVELTSDMHVLAMIFSMCIDY